jgi:hypothetical protein
MAGKHFAGDLGVARFVGAEESDAVETEEEEKAAESGEQKQLADTVLAEAHGNKCNAGAGFTELMNRASPLWFVAVDADLRLFSLS